MCYFSWVFHCVPYTLQCKNQGAVLAPHWNSRAMEIAIVRKGSGEIHVVYPNGSLAATEEVSEGMVFYIPKNYPMSQVASRRVPLEFIGFTTSSRPNRPQFLAGKFILCLSIFFIMDLIYSFHLQKPKNTMVTL